MNLNSLLLLVIHNGSDILLLHFRLYQDYNNFFSTNFVE
jgi:hypothetical protein